MKFAGLVHEADRQGDWMTLTVVADGLTFTVVMLESLAGDYRGHPGAARRQEQALAERGRIELDGRSRPWRSGQAYQPSYENRKPSDDQRKRLLHIRQCAACALHPDG